MSFNQLMSHDGMTCHVTSCHLPSLVMPLLPNPPYLIYSPYHSQVHTPTGMAKVSDSRGGSSYKDLGLGLGGV